MRIVRLETVRIPMALSRPYTIAYETVTAAENLFLQVVTDSNHVGLGCAAPDPGVTGETMDDAVASLNAAAHALVGADPLRRAWAMDQMAPAFAASPAGAAALDMALLDLLGKVSGQPVYRLLGGFRTSMPTSVTISIDTVTAMIGDAKERVRQRFQALKIKGGREVEDDILAVKGIRDAVGPAVSLRFDANQGYDTPTALRFLEETDAANLELFEQPTPSEQLRALGRVTQQARIPVMADESLLSLQDAFHLAAGERADMVNVKLMKVGGIDAALQVNAVARAAGLEAMVGCMDESALAIAAGLALALSRPNIQYADLDGHLDLVGDPAANLVELRAGTLYPREAPGLGLVRLGCFE